MTTFLQLRSAPSGASFTGSADGETVLWNNTRRAWYVGASAGGVTSVFGRTGAVVAETGDYDSDQITNLSSVPGSSVSDALDNLIAAAGVTSVFGRTGAVVAETGDYDTDEVTNVSAVAGTSTSDALETLEAAIAAAATGIAAGDLAGNYPNPTVIAFTETGGPARLAYGAMALGGLLQRNAGNVVSGLVGTTNGDVPAWNSVTSQWVSTTLTPIFNIPTNPGDTGKIPIVSAGNFTYTAGASAGQALIWSGTAWAAGVDFAAQQLKTSGSLWINSASGFTQYGLTPGSGLGSAASAGTIRWHADQPTLRARNIADDNNVRLLRWGGPAGGVNDFEIGSTGAAGVGVNNLDLAVGTGNITLTVSSLALTVSTGSFTFSRDTMQTAQATANPVWTAQTRTSGAATTVTFKGQNTSVASVNAGKAIFSGGDGTSATGARRGGTALLQGGTQTSSSGTPTGGHAGVAPGTAAGGNVGNIALGIDPDSASYGTMQGGIYVFNAAVAPAAGSTNGFKFYSVSGDPYFMTAAGAELGLLCTTQTTVGAAGGASALPGTPTGYLKVKIAGTTFVQPYYAAA